LAWVGNIVEEQTEAIVAPDGIGVSKGADRSVRVITEGEAGSFPLDKNRASVELLGTAYECVGVIDPLKVWGSSDATQTSGSRIYIQAAD